MASTIRIKTHDGRWYAVKLPKSFRGKEIGGDFAGTEVWNENVKEFALATEFQNRLPEDGCPSLCTTHGIEPGCYLLLELCGSDLSKKLPSIDQADRLLKDVLTTVDVMHRRMEWVHGDIFDKNVLFPLEQGGHFKVVDFLGTKKFVKDTICADIENACDIPMPAFERRVKLLVEALKSFRDENKSKFARITAAINEEVKVFKARKTAQLKEELHPGYSKLDTNEQSDVNKVLRNEFRKITRTVNTETRKFKKEIRKDHEDHEFLDRYNDVQTMIRAAMRPREGKFIFVKKFLDDEWLSVVPEGTPSFNQVQMTLKELADAENEKAIRRLYTIKDKATELVSKANTAVDAKLIAYTILNEFWPETEL